MRVGEPLSADGTRSPAPTSGRIAEASQGTLVGGRRVDVVLLEAESADSSAAKTGVTQAEPARTMLKTLAAGHVEKTLGQFLRAGIEADRWSSPDLTGQLRAAIDRPVHAVLCGAIDLDPALPLNQVILAEHALDVAVGVAALGRILGAHRAVLALPEDSPPQIVSASRNAAHISSVSLFPLLNEYPIANASLLIRRVLGRRLSPEVLPTDAGVVLLDAMAALAVARFLLHNEPMLHVPIGIYDPSNARGHMFWAPVGARVGDILSEIGVEARQCQMRAGHVLRDIPVDCESIVSGSGELKIFPATIHAPPHVSACLRCGWCIEACPVRINPAGLLEASQQQDLELARRYGLRACIECGICSYVCPSRLPLLECIRVLRMQTR